MKERNKTLFENLSLILGILLLCVILIVTVSSLKTTGACYTSLKDADLSQGTESLLFYDDHMFAQIGFGINILPNEADGEARLASFLSSSVSEIETRIITCGLLYSMMVSVVLQYFIYGRYHNKRKKHLLGILIASVAPFIVFAAAVLIAQAIFGFPTALPDAHGLLLMAIGLLSAIAGNFALSAALCSVRRKVLAAILAVPAVLILFILSMNLELHLYASPTNDSFGYFYDSHPEALEDDYDGECYYDEAKNVMILDGAEYPPETVDNPEYYTGWKRPCAFLFELVCAYSGNGLLLTDTINTDSPIPYWAQAAYTIKAAMWIALSLCLMKRARTEVRIK